MSYALTGNPDVRFWADAQRRTGAIRETMSRKGAAFPNQTGFLTNNKSQFTSITLVAGDIITNAVFFPGSTVSVLPLHGWYALYDSSLNCIRQTTDQLTVVWTASTEKPLALDSVPVTAGSRTASTTAVLTLPTLNQVPSALFAIGDNVVVANANVATYNGTWPVTAVSDSGHTISVTTGTNTTDSLASPFPTVQMAAGKRTFTVPTTGLYYLCCAQACTTSVSSFIGPAASLVTTGPPILTGHDNTNTITGTAISPAAALTVDTIDTWAYVS